MGPKPLWKVLSPVNSQASSSTRLRDRLNEILAEPIKPVVTINDSFKLRDFQADAIDAVLHALVNDKLTSIGVSAPAGSGKTTIFTTLIPLIPEVNKGNKVLIIVPSVVLIAQTENVIRERYPKRYQIGFEQGERSTHSDDDIIIGTWQSLQYPDRIAAYRPEEFKVVIVDEAHHAPAAAFLKVLYHFNDEVEMGDTPNLLAERHHGHQVPIIGFFPTFARNDCKHLSWTFKKVIYHLGLEELLAKQLLAKVEIKSAWLELQRLWTELQDKKASGGPVRVVPGAKKALKPAARSVKAGSESITGGFMAMWKIIGTHEVNQKVVEIYQQEAQDRHSTLVFCANIAVMRDLASKFRAAGVKAESISAKTPNPKKAKIINEFKQQKLSVILNVEVFREGTDLPSVDCIILANPTACQNSFSQMIGRGFRLSPSTGKTACLILDLFGICSRFNLSVEPSLDGKEPPSKRIKCVSAMW